MRYYDMHSHILPGMDDGCKDTEQAITVLKDSYAQGVGSIAATPHYYPKENIEQFLHRREKSYQRLIQAMDRVEENLPEICIGAEVAYRIGISREEELRKLCYGDSRFLLLELPFSKWNTDVFRDIEYISRVRGLIPVIAHLERYTKFEDHYTMSRLLDMNVLIQMNAEYYLDFWTKGKAKKKVRSGQVQVMGSDCHNPVKRPPNLGTVADAMCRSGLEEELYQIMDQNREIFLEAQNK